MPAPGDFEPKIPKDDTMANQTAECVGRISLLRVYPVKSTAGIDLTSAHVEGYGLRHDRRFMLVDENGRFLDARRCPKMLGLSFTPVDNGIRVAGSEGATFTVDAPDQATTEEFVLWKASVAAVEVSPAASEWFSAYLSIRCRLVSVPPFPAVGEGSGTEPTTEPASFMDSRPVLIVSQSALDALNVRIGEELSMERFRPNIVVGGCSPHAEDTWTGIRVGDVDFEIVGPCERCVLTMYDPKTLKRHPQSQPIRALGQYRRNARGRVTFGAYAVRRSVGRITVGDPVKAVE